MDHYESFSVYKYDKECIIFDKPFYLGFCVLDLSKLWMYESFFIILFHFGKIKFNLLHGH